MSGLRPEERFSNLERIGRGSFGAVYRCTDIVSRDTVAVKIIDLEQAEDEIDDIQQVRPLTSSAARLWQRREHTAQEGFASRSRLGAPVPSQRPESATSAAAGLMWQEIAVMSQCDSPYVTRYFGSYVSGTKLWIVMEYVGGGSVLVRSTPTHCLVANPNPNPSQDMVPNPNPSPSPAQDMMDACGTLEEEGIAAVMHEARPHPPPSASPSR